MASFKSVQAFLAHAEAIGWRLPCDTALQHGPGAPLARPLKLANGMHIGNRFAVLPMEGWDGTLEGTPGAATIRRWRRFGESGAKLIWGGEAVAVCDEGRANPRQLVISRKTWPALARLREGLLAAHCRKFGQTDDLLTGLQLTHSGRFAQPTGAGAAPRTLYVHPALEQRIASSVAPVLLRDGDIDRIIDRFIAAAGLAQKAGFQFVDIKHCHGYLGHEFLSAKSRPGRFGGSFENRTRFLREIVAGIRAEAPGLEIGVRLSAFDWRPFRPGADGVGMPVAITGAYPYAFGSDATGLGIDLREPSAFLALLQSLDIRLVCLTAGSPYYTPHIQRPALFPPSDGYLPPEDPLAGVARQIAVTAALKERFPALCIVGSGYSYLQEYVLHVAQNVIRTEKADVVGFGRLALSYPQLPADYLAGRPLQRTRFCRTFSDCTTAPRNGMPSGCYPLDPYYKNKSAAARLRALKNQKPGRKV